MALDLDKFAVPDGAPAGGVQKMKSVSFGELATLMGNANYKFPITDGAEGDVITSDGAGLATFKPVPRASTLTYRFNTTITSPPASGQTRLNNATQNSATEMFVNDVTFNGSDVSSLLTQLFVPGSIIRIQRDNDAGQFKDFDVTSSVDIGGSHTVTVVFKASGGADFGNNNNLLMTVLTGTSASSTFETLTTGASITAQNVSARLFKCDASGGAFTVNLPPAPDVSGFSYAFVKSDSGFNAITLDPDGAETIGGQATVSIDGQDDSLLIISDGSNWVIASTNERVVGFLADRTGEAQQSIPTGTPTVIELNQEQIDVPGQYNPVNFTWTPQPGIFVVQASARIISLDSNDSLTISILKNGTPIYSFTGFATINNQDVQTGTIGLTGANGTDDYTVQIEHNQGGALNLSSLPNETYFYGYRIG